MTDGAVVLHAHWRSSSTYVWAKFRQRSDTYCYFEPLNEHLDTLTPEVIELFQPWSYAHHPDLDAPYLEEFRPLIAGGCGVARFPAHLTYGHYRADAETRLPELTGYFAGLAAHAEALGKRPVHGLVRSSLRVGWFRAHVPGTHLFIRRAPRCQFLSMLNQAVKGNPYFLRRGLVILQHNLAEPAFAPLLAAIEHHALPVPDAMEVAQAPLPQLYVIFYFLHLLAARQGEPLCDFVIDIDRITLDAGARREAETAVADLTGMPLSFADCAVQRYEQNLDWSGGVFDDLEQRVQAMLPEPTPTPQAVVM